MPKISNLPAAASAIATDLIPAVQGGVTKKETLAQILTLYAGTIVITEAQVTGLVADLASKLNLSGGTMTGNLNMGGFSITNMIPIALAYGGTNAALVAANGAIPYSTATAFALLAPGTTGQLFRSGGAGAPTWSTATFPATGGAAGNVLISDGTNYISSTSLWPNTVGAVGKILRSNGTANAYTTATYPDTAGTIGNVLKSDGTNFVSAADTPGALTNTHIYVGDVSNVAQDVAVSGDATMANTGALSVVSVTGTATNNNAAAGKVGEFVSSVVALGAAVNVAASGSAGNLTSISLTAGDWDVWGNIWWLNGTITQQQIGWISSTSATLPDVSLCAAEYINSTGTALGTNTALPVPQLRFSLSGTTTIYLSGLSGYTGTTPTYCGGIYARRRR